MKTFTVLSKNIKHKEEKYRTKVMKLRREGTQEADKSTNV
jgi:hypothetical protein